MDYEFLLRKIRTLQEGAKTEGERRAADKAAKRIMEKYGISDIDQYRIEEHTFKYAFEYLMRLHHLMEGLSDSSIHKALPEQGGI